MRGYGNVNLKGRKQHKLGCGCCVAFNPREDLREKEDKVRMRKAYDEYLHDLALNDEIDYVTSVR